MALFYDLTTYYLYQPIGDKLTAIYYNNDPPRGVAPYELTAALRF
jgi:hypothetical protein